MVDSAYFLAPQVVRVQFEVAPAYSAFESIRELDEINRLSGLGDWVTQTAANLPPERQELTQIINQAFHALFYHVMPVMVSQTDFLGYVDTIAARDPYQLRDDIFALYGEWPEHYPDLWPAEKGELTAERLLNDEETFVSFVSAACEQLSAPINPLVLRHAFALVQDPPRMQATIVEHLRWLWEEALADEWQRVQPMLEESVAAFQRMDFSNMTALEAARIVTTRDLSRLFENMETFETVIFVPSAHIGPYVTLTIVGTTVYLMFGARLPRNSQVVSSALSRSELLTRLNALGDDTRLRILELLTHNEELCAQDIIERLDLSQSSISRHLSQLTANGFITERRRDVSKCYSLNTDRVMDTLRTLTNYLSRQ